MPTIYPSARCPLDDSDAPRSTLFRCGLLLAAALITGCAGTTPVEGVPPEEARVQVEAPVDELVRYDEPLSLLAAVRTEGTLLISYEVSGETHSAKATWDQEQNISVHSDWFPVYYLEPVEPDAMAEAAATAKPVANPGPTSVAYATQLPTRSMI